MISGLALCAGAGGLELGLRLALGGTYRTVGYVEREAFAAACLVARMEDQTVDRAPVWDDLTTFDCGPWRGRVDLISAGFPCQPASHAGQRLGTDDERWLWPHVARVVREVGPRLVFLENVPGLLSVNDGRAMRQVLGDLAALGFDAEWLRLSAADVGATQLRERLWLLAHRHDSRLPLIRWEPQHDGHPWDHADRQGGAEVAHPGRVGDQRQRGAGDVPCPPGDAEQAPPQQRDGNPPGDGREALARSHGVRGDHWAGTAHDEGRPVEPAHRSGLVAHPESVGQREPHDTPGALPREQPRPDAGRRSGSVALATREGQEGQGLPGRAPERGLWPPRPDDRDAWDRTDGPQPSVRRMADGLAHRLDRLHTTGNGVVPLVAAVAFLRLAQRAGLLDRVVAA